MNFQSDRFVFDLAVPSDGKEILDIIEQNEFRGRIALLYTRRPDAYVSLKSEGDDVSVVVCRDLKAGRIAGFGACAVRNLFVNGKPEKVGYLLGLRSSKEYRKVFPLLARGYEYIHLVIGDKASVFLTTILEDNIYAQRMLEKKRPFMPDYVHFGNYEVYALKTGAGVKKRTELQFKRAEKDDIPALVQFLNGQGSKYDFFPVLNEDFLLKESLPGLRVRDFYILYNEKDGICAAGAAWNQSAYKQYIIQGYGGVLKYLYPLSCLFPVFGYPPLPKPGSMLIFFTLSFWAVRDNDPGLFKCFIENISRSLKEYRFFLVGVHERNPLRDILKNIPSVLYRSKVYSVNWEKKGLPAVKLEAVPYLECGLL